MQIFPKTKNNKFLTWRTLIIPTCGFQTIKRGSLCSSICKTAYGIITRIDIGGCLAGQSVS